MPEIFPSSGAPTGAVDDIGELLHRINRQIRQRAREELTPLGITPAQARALRILAGAANPLRMSDLADCLGIARRTATTVVDELAARGLVKRRDDATDRRAIHVEVTRRGIDVTRRIAERRRDALRRLLGGLGGDEVAELRRLLHRLDDPTGTV